MTEVFSWCQQPGIAGKGSSCQEKPHNLPCRRNPQQKHKAFAGFIIFRFLFRKDGCFLLLLQTLSK